MSGFIFDDEESGVEWWGIKFPHSLQVQKALEEIRHHFPALWDMMMSELRSGGLDVEGEIRLTPMMALDAIKAGLICPVYQVDSEGYERIVFTFWSPFAQQYVGSDDLDEFELDWLVAALNIVWSVN